LGTGFALLFLRRLAALHALDSSSSSSFSDDISLYSIEVEDRLEIPSAVEGVTLVDRLALVLSVEVSLLWGFLGMDRF
jgi:hypothetical protein